jgi:hypothetical protein
MQPTNTKGSHQTPSREPQLQSLPDTISPLTQGKRENSTHRSNSSSVTTRYIRETGSQTNFLGQNYIRYSNSRGVIPHYIIFINDDSVSSISDTGPADSPTQENYQHNTSDENNLTPNKPGDHLIQEIQTTPVTVPKYITFPNLRLGRKKRSHRSVGLID